MSYPELRWVLLLLQRRDFPLVNQYIFSEPLASYMGSRKLYYISQLHSHLVPMGNIAAECVLDSSGQRA